MDVTTILYILIVVVILVIDLFLYLSNMKTFTQKTIEWSKKYPAVTFTWGFLMGHFFG